MKSYIYLLFEDLIFSFCLQISIYGQNREGIVQTQWERHVLL